MVNVVEVDFYFMERVAAVVPGSRPYNAVARGAAPLRTSEVAGSPGLARLKSLTRAALRRWKSFGA